VAAIALTQQIVVFVATMADPEQPPPIFFLSKGPLSNADMNEFVDESATWRIDAIYLVRRVTRKKPLGKDSPTDAVRIKPKGLNFLGSHTLLGSPSTPLWVTSYLCPELVLLDCLMSRQPPRMPRRIVFGNKLAS
jgi:hypothetical protein